MNHQENIDLDKALTNRNWLVRDIVTKLIPDLERDTQTNVLMFCETLSVVQADINQVFEEANAWRPSFWKRLFHNVATLRLARFAREHSYLTANLRASIDVNSSKLLEFAELDQTIAELSKRIAANYNEDIKQLKRARVLKAEKVERKWQKAAATATPASHADDGSSLMLGGNQWSIPVREVEEVFIGDGGTFGGAGASGSWATEEQGGKFS